MLQSHAPRSEPVVTTQSRIAIRPGPNFRGGFADDHGFAGRFAEFLQAANRECPRQPAGFIDEGT